MSEGPVVSAEQLTALSLGILRGMGASEATASEVARHLVTANLSGHDSHGVLRLAQYVGEMDRGELVPGAETELVRASAVCALFDAQRGLGQRSTMIAAEWVLRQAHEHGLAAAAVRHSMHIGRLGEYGERLAGEGLVGIVTVGVAGQGSGTVAPFGGTARFLGTNPWCMAVPAEGRPPFVFDAATSALAEGKVRLALAKGAELPAGAVFDPQGAPTRDPAQLYAGGTLAAVGGELAGHKGFGLSLAAALVGSLAMIGDPNPSAAGTMRRGQEWGTRLAGVFLVAVEPGAFGDALDYRRQVAEVLDSLAAVPAAPGVERVLVAGDPERATRERRRHEGIPVPAATWAELTTLAERFGLAVS